MEDAHDVSLFVDAKMQGLQLEASKYASRAIASVIQAFQSGMSLYDPPRTSRERVRCDCMLTCDYSVTQEIFLCRTNSETQEVFCSYYSCGTVPELREQLQNVHEIVINDHEWLLNM